MIDYSVKINRLAHELEIDVVRVEGGYAAPKFGEGVVTPERALRALQGWKATMWQMGRWPR